MNNDAYQKVGEYVSIFKRGSKWYANFQADGRQHRESLGTQNRREAVRRALQIDRELVEGNWGVAPKDVSLADAVDTYRQYLVAEKRAKKTLSKYNFVFAKLLSLAQTKRRTLTRQVDRSLLDAYRAQRSEEGNQAVTIYHETIIILQLTKFAFQRGLVSKNPLQGVRITEPKPSRQPCWDWEQVQRILEASPDNIRPVLTLLSESGMRLGEMAWLAWDDVDFAANVLHVRPKGDWTPKTGNIRAVPMSPTIQTLLRSCSKSHRWVFTMPPTRDCPVYGRQWTGSALLKRFKRVVTKLGFDGHIHTFRHSFISNALLNGHPPDVVREWVGQVDPEILALYTHIHSRASQESMARLAEANRIRSADGSQVEISDQGKGSSRTEDETQIRPSTVEGRESGSAQNQHTEGRSDHASIAT